MYGILFDANLCIGCGSCMEACKKKNGLPKSEELVLSATDYPVVEDHGDDILRIPAFSLGFIAEDDPVTQDVHGYCFDILRGDIRPAVNQGVGSGRHGKKDGGAG